NLSVRYSAFRFNDARGRIEHDGSNGFNPLYISHLNQCRTCPDRVMTAHGEIAAGLYEYHTVIRFRTQRREQYCPAHDIVAARRVHKELPDMIMVLFHVEHLFLDRDRKSTRLNSSHVSISYA